MTQKDEPLAANEPLAIVGLACRLPGNIHSPSELWSKLLNGESCQTSIPASRFSKDAFYHPDNQYPGAVNAPTGYFLGDDIATFDNEFFNINNLEAQYMDPQQRQLLEVSYECLESAGIPLHVISGRDIGCYVANFTSDFSIIQSKDPELYHRYSATGLGMSILANRISHAFDLKGPSVCIDTACSGSLYALNLACSALRSGDCDGALVAASNLILTPEPYSCAVKAGMTSGTAQCHTFDISADGYARAEGIGALYVKRLSDAIRDGDSIRSVIRGIAVNSNGQTNGISLPSVDGQEAVIRKAYANAGLDPGYTDYIELHGTGTEVGDSIEIDAVSRILAHHSLRASLVGSIKTSVGHGEAVSGISAVIKVTLALEHGIIPASIGVQTLNPKLKLEERNVQVVTSAVPWPESALPRASLNSFGYGGSNGHVILDSAPGLAGQTQSQTDRQQQQYTLLPISAKSHNSLRGQQSLLAQYMSSIEHPSQNIAYTLSCRRTHLPYRAYAVIHPSGDKREILESSLPEAHSNPSYPYHFVFTGQGSQWTGMGRALIQEFPVFRRTIQTLSCYVTAFEHAPVWKLEDVLSQTQDTTLIHEAKVSQTACTALQIGLVDLLRSLSIDPSVVTGHSSGEIGAAYASGIIDARTAIGIAYYRGYAVSKLPKSGAMAAVGLDKDSAMSYIHANGCPGIEIACINSSQSVTVSGHDTCIDDLVTLLKAGGKFARRLRTDGRAYHSRHVHDISTEYEALLSGLMSTRQMSPETPKCRTMSSLYGGPCHDMTMATPAYWRRNLECPVLFKDAIATAVSYGTHIVIEIGPHSALKAPCVEAYRSVHASGSLYFSTLTRDRDPAITVLELVGHTFLQGDTRPIERLNGLSIAANTDSGHTVINDLPPYPWSHQKRLWNEGRVSREYRQREFPRHELLGSRVPGGSKSRPMWRVHIKPQDVPWLQDHCLNDSIVFPAAGYFSIAIEAFRQATMDRNDGTDIILKDVHLVKLLRFSDVKATVEILTELYPMLHSSTSVSSTEQMFLISSIQQGHSSVHVRGIIASSPKLDVEYPAARMQEHGLEESTRWYSALNREGHNFGPTFRHLNAVSRVTGHLNSLIGYLGALPLQPAIGNGPRYHIHPTVLDNMFQACLISTAAEDSSKLAGKVPSSIKYARVKPWSTSEPYAITADSRFESMHTALCNSQLLDRSGKCLIEMRNVELLPWRRRPVDELTMVSRQPFTEARWIPITTNDRLRGRMNAQQNHPPVDYLTNVCSAIDAYVAEEPGALRILCLGRFDCTELEKRLHLSSPLSLVRSFHLGDIESTGIENVYSSAVRRTINGDHGSLIFDIVIGPETGFTEGLTPDFFASYLVDGGRLLLPQYCSSNSSAKLEVQPEHYSPKGLSVFSKTTTDVRNEITRRSTCLIASAQTIHALEAYVRTALTGFVRGEVLSMTWDAFALNPDLLPSGTEVIFCAELERPLLSSVDNRSIGALQKLLERANLIIWLQAQSTTGTLNPDLALVKGLARSLSVEQPKIKFAIFNVGEVSNEDHYKHATQDLNFVLTEVSRSAGADMEYLSKDGLLHINRLEPIRELNERFTKRLSGFPITMELKNAGRAHLYLQHPGQFESMRFVQSPDDPPPLAERTVEVNVRAYSINGKDYYTLKGIINCKEATCALDFAGVVTRAGTAVENIRPGDRVVCMAPSQLATHVQVPEWACLKLNECENYGVMSTIPIVFSTAIYALHNLANLQPGETVLIHSGAGGVGLAAIQIARQCGAKIYVTVGSDAKKEFLINEYGLDAADIFSSRTSQFHRSLMDRTGGRGVDVILNSLTGDLLRSSWDLIAEFGRFIDISKKDCMEGGLVGMGPFARTATYSAFDLSNLYWSQNPRMRNIWRSLLVKSVSIVRSGGVQQVQPIEIYSVSDIAEAFKRFGSSERTGKVIISFEDPTSQIRCVPQKYSSTFAPDKNYILIGCFGGLGQVLSRWMVERGARHLTFMSRSGPSSNAATELLEYLKYKGATVNVVRGDISRLTDVENVVSNSAQPIGGVVNAAMSLDEALFSEMTTEKWHNCIDPKVRGSWNLFQALLPHTSSLSFLLLTSSVAGTVGLSTESNYCAANSFLDHFATYARRHGIPAVSLGLGILSGLGYVHERPEIEKMLLRKGITAYDRDEVLLLLDLALSSDAPAHLVTGLELPALQSLAQKGFDPGNSIFADPRAKLFLNALRNSAEASAEASNSSDSPPNSAEPSIEQLQIRLRERLSELDLGNEERLVQLRVLVQELAIAVFGGILIIPRDRLSDTSKLSLFGLDSMLATEYRNGIFKAFGVHVELDGLLQDDITIASVAVLVLEVLLVEKRRT